MLLTSWETAWRAERLLVFQGWFCSTELVWLFNEAVGTNVTTKEKRQRKTSEWGYKYGMEEKKLKEQNSFSHVRSISPPKTPIPALGPNILLFSGYRRHFTHDYICQGVKPKTHYHPAKAKGQNPRYCVQSQHIFVEWCLMKHRYKFMPYILTLCLISELPT